MKKEIDFSKMDFDPKRKMTVKNRFVKAYVQQVLNNKGKLKK